MDRKNIGWVLVLILLVVAAITFLFIQLSSPSVPEIDISTLGPEMGVTRGKSEDGTYTLGDPDAPVELVIYEDYGCSACANFKQSYEESFLKEYVASGDVYLKIFPIGIVSQNVSIPALGALYCAESEGYFWEFRHLLFVNLSKGLTQEKYVAFATLLGIEKNNFVECITSTRYSDQIIQQNDSAWENGIKNTPSFQLDGEIYEGLRYVVPEGSEELSLKKLLDNALNK